MPCVARKYHLNLLDGHPVFEAVNDDTSTASEPLDGYGSHRRSWFYCRDSETPVDQWFRGDTSPRPNLDCGSGRQQCTEIHDRIKEGARVARPVSVIFKCCGIELSGSILCHPPQISHPVSLVGVGMARNLDPRYLAGCKPPTPLETLSRRIFQHTSVPGQPEVKQHLIKAVAPPQGSRPCDSH